MDPGTKSANCSIILEKVSRSLMIVAQMSFSILILCVMNKLTVIVIVTVIEIEIGFV